jgi:RimJ/RimL family protein N-acetyltransferase
MSPKVPPKAGARRAPPKRPTPKSKPVRPRIESEPVEPDQVHLVRTKGTPGRGGGSGGEAWRIETGDKRAGVVFINLIDEPPVGVHASIQIYLNAPSQGRCIGRVAYRLACESSSYDLIYAHMRKSNTASRRAAEEAGFREDPRPGHSQLLMVWHRRSQP